MPGNAFPGLLDVEERFQLALVHHSDFDDAACEDGGGLFEGFLWRGRSQATARETDSDASEEQGQTEQRGECSMGTQRKSPFTVKIGGLNRP
jgi:hypothetical protein